MTASHELRVRHERLLALLAEKKRRERLNIERDKSRWYDRGTKEILSDVDVIHREVKEFRERTAEDVKSKVIVDRAWLASVLGEEEYDKALISRKIMSLEAWL